MCQCKNVDILEEEEMIKSVSISGPHQVFYLYRNGICKILFSLLLFWKSLSKCKEILCIKNRPQFERKANSMSQSLFPSLEMPAKHQGVICSHCLKCNPCERGFKHMKTNFRISSLLRQVYALWAETTFQVSFMHFFLIGDNS